MSEPPPDPRNDRQTEDISPLSEGEESFLAAAKNALDEFGSSLAANSPVAQPETLGPYRIVSVLGRGGMGTVYEAEQKSPKRPVALKVVQGGRYVDEQYLRLFVREAQTLARLRHPGIAAIYEAGRTADGQHYFAMELVRGTTLNDYVRNLQLDRQERLRLFCDICGAINYAHQRGVIHRDLKPSNILVDTEGHTKILDFGLARITEVDIAATNVVTSVGQIQGTIAYMSPEQARGNPDEIDLRSDVYSLGVILYELMTERRPHDLDRSVLHEAIRTICEDAPVKPSTLNRTLRGDIETIMLKALEKEPTRRYQSAAALKEDIERFLTSHPILARPPSALYQFRKLASRHKAGFGFVITLFAVVVGFSIWTLEAEQRARNEAETAVYVSNFLVDLFGTSDPDLAVGGELTARQILEEGARRIAVELHESPHVQGRLMITMGLAYRNLGLYPPATKLLDGALRARRAEFGDESPEVAECLFHIGWLYRLKGDYTKAERLVTQALAMRRRFLGDDHPNVAETLGILAAVRRDQGSFSVAEEHSRESLSIWRRRLGDQEQEKEVAFSLETLSEILELEGKYHEAERHARDALEIRRRQFGADHHYVASSLQALAAALRGQGRYKEGEVAARDALRIYRKAMGDEHQYVASAATLVGGILRDQGEYDESGALLRQADANLRQRFKEKPEHFYIALSSNRLAWLYFETEEYTQAERLFSEAVKIHRNRFGREHPDLVRPLLGLGRTRHARGDAAHAERDLREALTISQKTIPEGHWFTASAMSALGHCLTTLGRFVDAEQHLLAGYRDMKAIRGEADRYVGAVLERIINLYEKWGKTSKANQYRALRRSKDDPAG